LLKLSAVALPLGAAPLSSFAQDGQRNWWDQSAISDQLAALFSTIDGRAIMSSIINLITDPSIPALASSALQSLSGDLTNFQTDLLKALLVITSSPGLLSALLSGSPLSRDQKLALASIRANLRDNPAVGKLFYTAAQLKGTSLLPTYVNGTVQNILPPLQTPIKSTGNSLVDHIINDTFTIQSSPAYGPLATALVAIMEKSTFISFLQTLPPQVLANFIPTNVILGLLLPNDRDPPLSPYEEFLVSTLFNIGVFLFAIITLPAEALTLPVIGLAGLILIGSMVLTFNSYEKAITPNP